MRLAPVYSLTPLKDILRHYNELSVRGFNSEVVNKSLENLLLAVRGRGNQPRVQSDYSLPELDQSWRMQKIIEDIEFGLRPDQFFSANDLAETARTLGDLGYKNTDLLPKFFEKVIKRIPNSN